MDDDIKRYLIAEEKHEYFCKDKEVNTSRYTIYEGHRFHHASKYVFEKNRLPSIRQDSKVVREEDVDIQDKIMKVVNMPCRDDDILIMTTPKSGTNWLTNIVTMLTNGNTEYIDTPRNIEYNSLAQFTAMSSPRVMYTHCPFKLIPEEMKNNKSKIIAIHRNPKDTMVSGFVYSRKLKEEMSWFHGNWEGYFRFYLSKDIPWISWFEHIKMWKSVLKDYPNKEFLFLSFEDMKTNLFGNVMRINRFIGAERSDEFCQEVVTRCTFSYMKENAYKGKQPHPKVFHLFENGFLPIYRKGEIGDWKNWFTVAQSEKFDAVYREEMKDYDTTGMYALK